ncbi:MAG: ATP-binding protein [Coxiellaceae bacterium]|nr:ATP-binding protein [Coxiellaceae bacterium]
MRGNREIPFDYDSSYEDKTARSRLMDGYQQVEVVAKAAEPGKPFMAGLVDAMRRANRPYAEREGQSGLYYHDDFAKQFHIPPEEAVCCIGLSNSRHWDVRYGRNLFVAEHLQKPSVALEAWFQGPTIAECGSVLQACMFSAIHDQLGSEQFDWLFGSAVTSFVISPILYQEITSMLDNPGRSKKELMRAGNPIAFLFDIKGRQAAGDTFVFDESEIQPGDIVYIKGVAQYAEKHVGGGAALGWNVICVGINSATGEKLYLGFGPGGFQSPLTLAELRKILVQLYNQPQSITQRYLIEKALDGTAGDYNHAVAALADSLRDDTIEPDSPIVGIIGRARFNPEKLAQFIRVKQAASRELTAGDIAGLLAHFRRNCLSRLFRCVSKLALTRVTQVPLERIRRSGFTNYRRELPAQQQLYQTAMKALLKIDRGEAGIVIMTGHAGLGKTHLCFAVANRVMQKGKRVFFADEDGMGRLYQQLAERDSSKVDERVQAFVREAISQADLIIMDDVNEGYCAAARMLQVALDEVCLNNKVIMVSANHRLHTLEDRMSDYCGYDHPLSTGLVISDQVEGVSYRQAWWQSVSAPVVNPLAALSQFKRAEAASILFEGGQDRLREVLARSDTAGLGDIKWVGAIYGADGKITADYYIHDYDRFDTFVVTVNSYSTAAHCMKLLETIHTTGKRIVICADSEADFTRLMDEQLSVSGKRAIKMRDRLRTMVMKPSDFPASSVGLSVT